MGTAIHMGFRANFPADTLLVRERPIHFIAQRIIRAVGRSGVVLRHRSEDLEEVDVRLLCDLGSMKEF